MNTHSAEELKKAMDTLKDLAVPEHLQDTALRHLLKESSRGAQEAPSTPSATSSAGSQKQSLRTFLEPLTLKGAVAEIPVLIYWARESGERTEVNERELVELYRRAAMRPPKDISQSFRDLSSKKYLRIEMVEGKRGYFRLSRTGEDFVLHDVLKQS